MERCCWCTDLHQHVFRWRSLIKLCCEQQLQASPPPAAMHKLWTSCSNLTCYTQPCKNQYSQTDHWDRTFLTLHVQFPVHMWISSPQCKARCGWFCFRVVAVCFCSTLPVFYSRHCFLFLYHSWSSLFVQLPFSILHHNKEAQPLPSYT